MMNCSTSSPPQTQIQSPPFFPVQERYAKHIMAKAFTFAALSNLPITAKTTVITAAYAEATQK
jgi:hypothetical protein